MNNKRTLLLLPVMLTMLSSCQAQVSDKVDHIATYCSPAYDSTLSLSQVSPSLSQDSPSLSQDSTLTALPDFPLSLPHYREVSHPTRNYERGSVNDVQGVILHHTAEPSLERSLEILTSSPRNVAAHCVIDTDGTRYVMCEPTTVVYHAGPSLLNGRESCNKFCIGIEFQGNTLEAPLTEHQILSAIEYLLPIMARYNIPRQNIVTHEMVRTAYKKKHPGQRVYDKVDITQTEYLRFLEYFDRAMKTN